MASGVWWRLELERSLQGPDPQLPLLSGVRVAGDGDGGAGHGDKR